jgi:uncharacterized protein (DUF4415 family)
MSITRVIVKPDVEPTKEQTEEIKRAAALPITYDDDSPCFTKEEFKQMVEAMKKKREDSKKPVVSLRINPDTLEKAKATGRGYTGFLSRLLDLAINDPEMVRKSLEQM